MRELFIDFETYYDEKAKYSLKYMTTLEYVRDPRFKILGASVAYGDHSAMWIDDIDTLRSVLKQASERDVIFVGHNAAFDACVAYEGLGVRFKRYRCTMLMARYLISQNILPPESGTALRDLAPMVDMEKGHLDEALASGEVDKYCNLDVEICRALYNKYEWRVPKIEWDFMSMHIDCSAVAKFDLDIPLLKATAEKAKAREHLFPVVRKDDALKALLEARGVTVEYKKTPKGNDKPAFAKTDAFMKGLLEHSDPVVRQLAELRLEAYSTNERNKAQRFLDAGSPLACPLLYYAAHTGRSGGRDYNVQNMKRGGACRVALKAMPGKKLVIIDSSQVEVRTLAWLAHEEVLLNTFRRGEDVYKAFAGNYLFRKPIDEVTKEERQIAKPAVLALGFGQGVQGLIAYAKNYGVSLSDEMATRCVNVYRETFTAITGGRFRHKDGLWQREFAFALANGYTELPTGRRLYYPNLRKDGDEYVFTKHEIFMRDTMFPRLWPGLTIENLVQATARDLVFTQVLDILGKYPEADLCLLVHDEAVFSVPEGKAEEIMAYAEVAFKTPPAWASDIPVKGEGHISDRYDK